MRFLHLLVALGVCLGLFGAGCKKQSGDVIRVGEFASLSGSEASFGRSSHNGTLIAVDEIQTGSLECSPKYFDRSSQSNSKLVREMCC